MFILIWMNRPIVYPCLKYDSIGYISQYHSYIGLLYSNQNLNIGLLLSILYKRLNYLAKRAFKHL